MIQRIQTIYLLAAIVVHLLLFTLPVFKGSTSQGIKPSMQISGYISKTEVNTVEPAHQEIVRAGMNTGIIVLNGLMALASLITIFLFRVREIQLRITRLLMFLACGLIGLLFYSAEQANSIFGVQGHEIIYGYGIWLPLVSLLLFLLAARAILADEKLVRSADRLR